MLGPLVLPFRAADFLLPVALDQTDTTKLVVGQHRGVLQCLQQFGAGQLDLPGMSDRNHAVVVGKLAVDHLADELDAAEAETNLIGE